MQVPVQRTVCTPRDYARAFIRAWRELYEGAYPSQEQVGVLYAQWMVETGGSACWNWNIGNVKVTSAQVLAGVPWIDLPGTWEILGGKKVILQAGDPGRRFRAFENLDVSMPEHLRFLRGKRYASSWPFVEQGDPTGFAFALKKQGYYTASVEAYAAGMSAHFRIWLQSAAYDDALRLVQDEDEEPTQPAMDIRGLHLIDGGIVYGRPDLPKRELVELDSAELDDDEEPPPCAA